MADVAVNPDFTTLNAAIAAVDPMGLTDNKIRLINGYPFEGILFTVDGSADSVNPSVQTLTLVNTKGGFVYDITAAAWLSADVKPHATDPTKATVVATLVTAQQYLIYVYGVEVKRTA